MKIKLLALSISLVFSVVPVITQAEGDIAQGEIKAASCGGCHGEDGNSMAPSFPKLAEQHAGYLVSQLQAFKDNVRNAPMMAPLAMGLDDGSIDDIAAYYAAQKISANQMPVIQYEDEEEEEETEETTKAKAEELEELMVLGSDLYRNGNLETNLSACIACHGPEAEGNQPSSFPSLRSQHADYLIKALTDFKNGVRSNTPDNMMHMIAKKMTKKEIQAVSYHISMKK